jgi:hypothetical protein
MRYRNECGYGSEDHHGDLDHISSIKHGCLAAFLVKRLYVRLEVVEISFYHCAHTHTKGEFTHGQDDLNLQLGYHYMLPKCLKLIRTTFGPN